MKFLTVFITFCLIATACCKPEPVEPIKPKGAEEDPKKMSLQKEAPKEEMKAKGITGKGLADLKKVEDEIGRKEESKEEKKEKKEDSKEEKKEKKPEPKSPKKQKEDKKKCRDDKGKFKKCEPKKKK